MIGADIITGANGADTITGGAGADNITGGAGADGITGGTGNDTFNVNLGTDTITDLSTGDDLIVSSGATATATIIASFVADSDTLNSGTANLTARAAGGIIKVNAAGSGAYNINSGAGTDTMGRFGK